MFGKSVVIVVLLLMMVNIASSVRTSRTKSQKQRPVTAIRETDSLKESAELKTLLSVPPEREAAPAPAPTQASPKSGSKKRNKASKKSKQNQYTTGAVRTDGLNSIYDDLNNNGNTNTSSGSNEFINSAEITASTTTENYDSVKHSASSGNTASSSSGKSRGATATNTNSGNTTTTTMKTPAMADDQDIVDDSTATGNAGSFYRKQPSTFRNGAIYFEVGPAYSFDNRPDPEEVKLHVYDPKRKRSKKFNPRVLDFHYESRGESLKTVARKPQPYSFENRHQRPFEMTPGKKIVIPKQRYGNIHQYFGA